MKNFMKPFIVMILALVSVAVLADTFKTEWIEVTQQNVVISKVPKIKMFGNTPDQAIDRVTSMCDQAVDELVSKGKTILAKRYTATSIGAYLYESGCEIKEQKN